MLVWTKAGTTHEGHGILESTHRYYYGQKKVNNRRYKISNHSYGKGSWKVETMNKKEYLWHFVASLPTQSLAKDLCHILEVYYSGYRGGR